MLIGYARVSTQDQHLGLQEDALKQAGCEKIVVDQVSGTTGTEPSSRTVACRRYADRLAVGSARPFAQGLDRVDQPPGTGRSRLPQFKGNIDTTSPSGKLTFHLFGALAEFERNLIRERTQAGLAAARARGRQGGRPKALDADKRQVAVELYRAKKLSVKKICDMIGISKPTLYAYLRSS